MPCSFKSAALKDESTPPEIPTTTDFPSSSCQGMFGLRFSKAIKMLLSDKLGTND